MNKPFYVAIDASNYGIGGFLYQHMDNKFRYIGFVARSLSKSEQNYPTTKRELLAIVFTFKKFHNFLCGNKLTLFTYDSVLAYLHTQPIANPMIINWLDIICDYNHDITHRPGIKKILPNALSRLFQSDNKLAGGNFHKSIEVMLGHKRKADSLNQEALWLLATDAHNIPAEKQTSSSTKTVRLADYMTLPEQKRSDILKKVHLLGHFCANAIFTADIAIVYIRNI